MRILHITPHLGGGVGAVILNWVTFDKNNEHKIITLDYANDNAFTLKFKTILDNNKKVRNYNSFAQIKHHYDQPKS